MEKKKSLGVRALRSLRVWHRNIGLISLLFLSFTATTGLLLGWKKHSGGFLLAETRHGSSSDLKDWLSLDSLLRIAERTIRDSVDAELSTRVDRMEVRANKGVVKFTFRDHFWGLQIDGATGEVLFIERRRADLIERLHDGSFWDSLMGTRDEAIKLFYTTLSGLALLLLCLSGLWLWYGPKRLRRAKRGFSLNGHDSGNIRHTQPDKVSSSDGSAKNPNA
jgi:uncharacterized iron-regulated membrane protein